MIHYTNTNNPIDFPSPIKNLNEYLFALLGDWSVVEKWWHLPNKAFDGKTPVQVWNESDGQQKVTDYVMWFCTGDYS